MRAHIGTVAALLLSAGASAREIKGGPAILIGHWGSSAAACRGHHRSPDINQITKEYWSSCSGTACHKTIISHRRTKNGFVLKTAWRVAGEDKEGSFTFDVLAKNVIKRRGYFGRLRRCTQAGHLQEPCRDGWARVGSARLKARSVGLTAGDGCYRGARVWPSSAAYGGARRPVSQIVRFML